MPRLQDCTTSRGRSLYALPVSPFRDLSSVKVLAAAAICLVVVKSLPEASRYKSKATSIENALVLIISIARACYALSEHNPKLYAQSSLVSAIAFVRTARTCEGVYVLVALTSYIISSMTSAHAANSPSPLQNWAYFWYFPFTVLQISIYNASMSDRSTSRYKQLHNYTARVILLSTLCVLVVLTYAAIGNSAGLRASLVTRELITQGVLSWTPSEWSLFLIGAFSYLACYICKPAALLGYGLDLKACVCLIVTVRILAHGQVFETFFPSPGVNDRIVESDIHYPTFLLFISHLLEMRSRYLIVLGLKQEVGRRRRAVRQRERQHHEHPTCLVKKGGQSYDF